MFKTKILYVIIIIFIFPGCSKKADSDEQKQEIAQNKIELNLDTPDTSSTQQNREQPAPQQQSVEVDRASNFYLSGRTELLSIQSGKPIFAKDFLFGTLYDDYSATAEEKKIIGTCRAFFETINEGNPDYNLVDSMWIVEMKDYIDYFILGKIPFENVIFGKPKIAGIETEFRIRIYPGNIPAYIYLLKNEENIWLLSGLEMELNIEKNEENQEKWFPSISPSPFGY